MKTCCTTLQYVDCWCHHHWSSHLYDPFVAICCI